MSGVVLREHRGPHRRQRKLPLGVEFPQEREGLLPRDSRMMGRCLCPQGEVTWSGPGEGLRYVSPPPLPHARESRGRRRKQF